MRLPLLALAALVAATPAPAQHAGHGAPPPALTNDWTPLPLVTTRLKGRMKTEVVVANSAATEALVTPPQGEPRPLALKDGKGEFAPQVGNYHLVAAVDSCDTHVATAMTAAYFPNPGPAPTAILGQSLPGLTVQPLRLPREHGSYRAGETWRFRVAFDGQPFPGARVLFHTSNGTRQEAISDLDGMVDIAFPEDFAPSNPDARAGFVVAAISQTGARQNIGAFNHTYRPSPYDGASVWTGGGFAIAGMAMAAPFLRRRRKGGRT